MKTYEERCDSVSVKIDKLRVQRARNKKIITAACSCCAMLVLALVLFLPFSTTAPDVSKYADSPYYSLIQRINEATYKPPRFKNNFQKLRHSLSGWSMEKTDGAPNDVTISVSNSLNVQSANKGTYAEITDNQVAGVTEGDIIKRSDKYIYYLHGYTGTLTVYSIEGAESKKISSIDLSQSDEMWYLHGSGWAEMFLSQDCTTITIVSTGLRKSDNAFFVSVQNFDVTDPNQITQSAQILLTGGIQTSRVVDGDLLLVSGFNIRNNVDFSDESTFLPQIGRPGAMESIAAEDIQAPQELSSTYYTVITKLDGKTLQVQDSTAFLSYSGTAYVSKEHIYAVRNYTEIDENLNTRTMTEISCVNYAGETLEHKGSVVLEGNVKNQYSMDEHEGILRVVTSINNRTVKAADSTSSVNLERNANLYCVSLADWRIAASVERFAPDGEVAQSVRFDGDYAYVCTAEVIELTDPVYFFDLRDLANITYKDTGTINGYSSSLVNFGDGYLLGIGYGADRELKIEIYEESENGVVSVCSYEADAAFSEDYKSYFIDREKHLVGLGIWNWAKGGTTEYVLLQFNGYGLHTVLQTPLKGEINGMRGVLIDDYMYLFGDEFKVEKVW